MTRLPAAAGGLGMPTVIDGTTQPGTRTDLADPVREALEQYVASVSGLEGAEPLKETKKLRGYHLTPALAVTYHSRIDEMLVELAGKLNEAK